MKASSSRWALPAAAIALVSAGITATVLGTAFERMGSLHRPSAPVWADPAPRPAPAPLHVPHAPQVDVTDAELDPLRQAAALGNPVASLALVTALLDRSDDAGATGDTPALFEATQWLQRDWDTPEYLNSRLLERVVHTQCPANPLFKWHWLCNPGE